MTVDRVLYQPDVETPPERPHCFVYFITIHNDTDTPVTIRGRKWVVTNTRGEITGVEAIVDGDPDAAEAAVEAPLREVGADAARYENPFDTAGWADAIAEAMKDPATAKAMTQGRMEISPLPLQQFAAYVKEQTAWWTSEIKAAGIEPE